MARIIVVDTSSEARALCADLRVEGYDVELFGEPASALQDLRRNPADVVLVDLMIPGTTGLAFARAVRDAHPATRVVLTGAYQLSERQLLRADCGAVGFVPKPYGTREIAAFLHLKMPSTSNNRGVLPSIRARAV
jgi:DNA-binding response OmpR family regulator